MSEKQQGTFRGPRGGHGPGGMGMTPVEKPKDFKGSLRRLLKYLGDYRQQAVFVVIFAVLGTVFNIVGPKILARATNALSDGIIAMARGTGSIDFGYIGNIIGWLIVLYGISAIFTYLQGWIMAGVSNDITYRLRRDISVKIHKLPLKYFESTSQGEVLSRITNDVDAISQNLNQSIVQIITSVTTMIGVLVMMLSISVLMTGLAILIIPCSAILSMLIIKRSQKYFAGQQQYLGAVNGRIEETYGGQMIIRAFRGEERAMSQFGEQNDRLYDSAWRSQFLSGLIMPAINFIGNLGYVMACVVGAARVATGNLDLGGVQAFLQYIRSFNQPIAQVANISNVLQQTAAAAERVFAFMDQPEEAPEDASPVTYAKTENGPVLRWTDEEGPQEHPFRGTVEFCHVAFGYDPDKLIIHDFSAFVEAGQKVAIVGPTGAGKTTIVKLLMRYYDVTEGCILLDGIDIRRYSRESLRSALGMVLQDTWLYGDTIRENIRYGDRTAPDSQVLTAAKAARVDHFARTLPGGYDMTINEESSNISAGQKQLITIARAVLADPQVLILDEATSSVDTKTEVDIQHAMDTLMQGRTSFIIAHRLSTIRDCGTILMLRDGDIVEQGSHKELLEKNGAYAEMYNSQFESA
ncbi:MAG: ABC transporter ATP-binding protein [Clostridiaceae bacterium]|nr:ABC transporter ATP-binding protein [Clostridiaceae bacterium]